MLERYAMGTADAATCLVVERMAAAHAAVREELDEIHKAVQHYAQAHAVAPHPSHRTFLLATIDYMDRLQKGEAVSFPPLLHEGSKVEDYNEWLQRTDMTAPAFIDTTYAKMIGHTPELTTAIVWIKHMAPEEVHHEEHEKFLILEGTCDIHVDTEVHHMRPGSYFSIPLHSDHRVVVTSEFPCKVLLQRLAA